MKKTWLLVLLLCGLAVPAHALDCFVNFGIVTVASAGTTDTTLTLANGQGSTLPDPATCGGSGAYNLTWFDASLYRSATDDPNREIIRVTARSSDTLTVTRAQESTTAKAHNVPGHTYKLANELTAKTITDLASGGQLADGTVSVPSLSFATDTDTGFYGGSTLGANLFAIANGGASQVLFGQNLIRMRGTSVLAWAAGAPDLALEDTTLTRGGVGYVAFNSRSSIGSNAVGKLQIANTTGTVALTVQTTGAPTCTSNCGTSPSVVGTDSAMIVTMGASGSPASGWVVTFNGTWAAAPACVAQMAKAGMAATHLALTMVATASTLTVVTNGAAPSNSDVYAIQCFGVQ